MDKTHCVGCDENFYNGNNPYGIEECWHLKTAKVIKRYRTGINVPWTRKENFVEVLAPNCYRKNGYCYIGELPKHLRG